MAKVVIDMSAAKPRIAAIRKELDGLSSEARLAYDRMPFPEKAEWARELIANLDG